MCEGQASIVPASCLPKLQIICSSVVHDAVHQWRLDHESFLYRAKLRHAAHHYGKQDGNFGVTTVFWDRVFGATCRRHSRDSP
jgi:sterol desaturase/sphingolipid hydroxylase (fatty acid hydroxylase superfamily)